MPDSANDIDELDEELKSKSEVKREMIQLQIFGQSLIDLSKHQRSKIPFTEDIKDALILADKIKNKHEALRRHVRHLARMLSEADLEPIKHALDVMANKHQQETAKFIKLEKMRDDVIDQGNDFIEALLSEHESMERQKLRQLVRQASKEKKAEKLGKYYKELFDYLKLHTRQIN
ncbi:MAG: ribosome-associated protein [Colwellia sp.]|jgi:ribosome-associated protein